MLANYADISNTDFNSDDDSACPQHNTPLRKVYTFGSCYSAETLVSTFKGCKCAVAEQHDPIGILPTVVTYHDNFASAGGVGKLRASDWAIKLAD